MIEIRELVKTFDGFAALDGASLTVPQGAIYGLVGPNGAGKSTLLRHLTGVYRQDSGTVSVDGADVWENVAVKQRIASIPDDWHYFMQSSIRDMMKFYRGFYPQFNMERYEKLRGVFSLDEKQLIRRLSKGMQKQAAFWIAMCCMPDYLILDEPVDGLDPVMRRQVWSLIMQDVAERVEALAVEARVHVAVEAHHVHGAGLTVVEHLVGDVGDAAFDGGVFVYLLAADQHGAGGLTVDAREMADERGFARAVRADKAVYRAVRHGCVQPVERAEAAVALYKTSDLYHFSASSLCISLSLPTPTSASSPTSSSKRESSSARRASSAASCWQTKLPRPGTEQM